ncbi:MAG: glycosyltransferase family 2 protein [Planctomycetota bacterium]|nr:glycosyltransferase family 2 protein [Planctomycetota bacterium]
MSAIEVWYAIPSASAANCARTLPEWRARGYRVALLQDADKRFDAPADVIVAPFDAYPGYGRAINHLIRSVVPSSAPIVVTGGDDMFPEMSLTASEIAEQFLERFPDTFGVMQPTGDRFGPVASICGSPWIGRAFAERVNGGAGPYCRAYFQLYEDQELHDVAEKLGVLWRRPDLCHLHRHWQRAAGPGERAKPPEYLEKSLAREAESRAIYEARKSAGFPGHEPLPAGSAGALAGVSGARAGGLRIVAAMPARNEAWIIGLSLSAALMWCDEAVVYDHGSTDETAAIVRDVAARHPGRVRLIEGREREWSEMTIRGILLEACRGRGATHVALIDADEILTADLVPTARELMRRGCVRGYGLRLPMISPWGGVERVRTDGAFGAMLWAGFAAEGDVAYRPPRDGYELHGRVPTGLLPLELRPEGGGGVLHMQFCAHERLVAKAVWYKLNEVLRYPGRATARQLNEQYDWALGSGAGAGAQAARVVPMRQEWWGAYRELAGRYLDLTARPWQADEVRRLVDEHGAARFAGIDFHGLLAGAPAETREGAAA